MMAFQSIKGAYKKVRKILFTRAHSDRARDNDFKLKQGRFRLDIRKKFFTMRVVRHWNRLSKEVVDASLPAVFKVSLHGCYGFAWQDFGSGGAIGVSSVRSCEKLPPCLIKPVPASSKMDLPLAKAKPISNGGSASGIAYLRRGRKKLW